MHSEIGSDASGDWELVCMEAVGQELRLKNCQAVVNNPHNPPQSLFSYADAVKKDAPHSTGREIGHYESPKRKYSEQKWQPVFQIRHVSVMDRPGLLPQYAKERLYDYCGFEDECDDAYESFKSFGSDARSNMLIANIAFGKKKDLGIIAAGSRTKSVK